MPKLKQPANLAQLAVKCLGRTVIQKAVEDTDTSALREYLYGELPDVLSQEVTAHMLAEVFKTLTRSAETRKDVSDDTKKILAVICHRIRVLDLSKAPRYSVKTLSPYIQTFSNLHTLIFSNVFGNDVPALRIKLNVFVTDVPGLSSLKFLAHFRMLSECTDDIVQTLGSCCNATIRHIDVSYSEQVTDVSFKALLECRKLRHISICGTSVTDEGFVQFLKDKKADNAAEGLLGLGFGDLYDWEVSSTLLSETALCSPMLKHLQIYGLRGDMETLIGLTKLEALIIHSWYFNECNFEGFLRVRGRDITSLELGTTDSIDIPRIMTHCVNIRELVVEDGILDRPLGKLSAYQTLQTLKLHCEFSSSSIIEGMLYACVNVTSLDLYSHYDQKITDELILRVLSNNPLQKLTRFAVHSQKLTMRSINAIIEHCPLVKEVQYFQRGEITHKEVKILRQNIKKKNQDLTIYI